MEYNDIKTRANFAINHYEIPVQFTNNEIPVPLTTPMYENIVGQDRRLLTFYLFKWPKRTNVIEGYSKLTPLEMANAGFFYTGLTDKVVCFYCGGSISNWERAYDPWYEHAVNFPYCFYVAIHKGYTYIKSVLQLDFLRKQMVLKKKTAKEIVDLFKSELENNHISYMPFIPTSQNDDDKLTCLANLHHEMINKHDLPLSKFLLKTNENDTKIDDNSSNIKCKICFENNIAFIFSPCYHMVACMQCITKLKRHVDPIHEKFVSQEERLNSLSKWPGNQNVVAKVAEAGFFYTGKQDLVTCFYCDGSIYNWNKYSDPWYEHAAHFPHCFHILITKGNEYINRVLQLSYIRKLECLKYTSEQIYNEIVNVLLNDLTSHIPHYTDDKDDDKTMKCKICFKNNVEIVLQPCTHMVTCTKCTINLKKCPTCNQTIHIIQKPIIM
uniref:Baculoviral IAP repeat-containing protein n=1 Tax=Metapenaeus ensis majanivirus TaxID=2984279 RepID=A0A9C7CDK9_9VIRU|nr:MAG: baculoviral IAP repeat-containing protein [Metapenaeus ensis majanivirus]